MTAALLHGALDLPGRPGVGQILRVCALPGVPSRERVEQARAEVMLLSVRVSHGAENLRPLCHLGLRTTGRGLRVPDRAPRPFDDPHRRLPLPGWLMFFCLRMM